MTGMTAAKLGLKDRGLVKEGYHADLVLFVVPSSVTALVAGQLAEVLTNPDVVLLSCAKGIEKGTGRRMSEIISETLPGRHIAVLSGPTHAEEVSQQLATCTVVGSKEEEVAKSLQKLLTAPHFRTYRSDDIAGMELGGATADQVALAWLLRHPSGIVPIIGSGQPHRVESAANAVGLELTREQWFKIWVASAGTEVP